VIRHLTRTGNEAATLIQNLGLWVVLLATVVAGIQEIWVMIEARQVKLTDLLLLFIYLEVITMVNVYWQSGKLPVRMPLYIAMIALARYLILEAAHLGSSQVLAVSGGILILALAVIVVRFGHLKMPYPEDERAKGPDKAEVKAAEAAAVEKSKRPSTEG